MRRASGILIRNKRVKLVSIATVLIIGSLLIAPIFSRQGTPVKNVQFASAPASAPATAQVVKVGTHILDVYSIDPSNSTWMCNFYIWWKWTGDIDPSLDWTIINSGDPQSHFKETFSYLDAAGNPEPMTMESGEKYQFATVSASLVSNFDYSRFPFDRQSFNIDVESNGYNNQELVYINDSDGATMDSIVSVHGWQIKELSQTNLAHTYDTTFGFAAGEVKESSYSLLRTSFYVDRPITYGLWKLFVPMFVIMLVGLLALFVHSSRFEERLALSGSSLLALIFLQQGYSGNIPDPAPLVLMDKIYALAYLGVLVTISRVIWVTNDLAQERSESNRHFKHDMAYACLIAVTFLISSAQLILIK